MKPVTVERSSSERISFIEINSKSSPVRLFFFRCFLASTQNHGNFVYGASKQRSSSSRVHASRGLVRGGGVEATTDGSQGFRVKCKPMVRSLGFSGVGSCRVVVEGYWWWWYSRSSSRMIEFDSTGVGLKWK